MYPTVRKTGPGRLSAVVCVLACVTCAATAFAQPPEPSKPTPATAQDPGANPASPRDIVFDMGQIVVVGGTEGQPGVGGSVLTKEQIWTFDRTSLDQAVNVVPGVISTFDGNGRRNESDVFVRGFGRWQVPLMVDGVRIYLPADNRLDFSRFLTADVAEIQIQKGYASVLDGPGAMGGAINLVTRKPAKGFEAEGSIWTGGRNRAEGWNGSVMLGTRQRRYYLQGSANYSDRNYWSLSGDYEPAARSVQPSRPPPQFRHIGLALQRQGGLDPERHRRIHHQLRQAARREGCASERLQQPARASEQLLALALLGCRRTRRSCRRRSWDGPRT